MHGYPVMQFVQYSVPPPCSWAPQPAPAPTAAMGHRHSNGIKKYVVWCLICGGFSCLLGILFLGVYFLLHSYTITVGNFETVPTFVPATLLILTGLCIMSLARRRNRYSYLIKLSGACGLISALCCALVTVTTTVLHMSRLQALRECEYAQKTRTCTCYSDMIESQVDRVDKEGVRLVFDSLSDCGVVHGSLYSCLRAIFGLSVAGVLVAVFSCMLVYQLLSHERKKMYWEQLELRCRSLYTSQQGPPPNVAAVAGGRGVICRCCEQCHAHRQVPLQAAAYPWDDGGEPRFWTGQPPGNFYSPNPGRDDIHVGNSATCRGHGLRMPNSRSRVTGWSWPRMPWQRSSPDPSSRFRQTPSSPDSQYGFSNNISGGENIISEDSAAGPHNAQPFNGLPYGVWGPPPPYSDPNSPARRGYYHHQYIQQPNLCNSNGPQNDRPINAPSNEQQMPCLNHRSAFLDQPNANSPACCVQSSGLRNVAKRQTTAASHNFQSKGDYENTHTPSDSDGGARDRDRCSNTLPTRKVKKRVEAGAKSIGPNSQPAQRVNVQQVFPNCGASDNEAITNDQEYHEPISSSLSDEANAAAPSGNVRMPCKAVIRHKRVENSAFQSSSGGECSAIACKEAQESCDPTESEVYFADVSSCCNMSVKNDNYYEDANQATQTHHHHPTPQHHHHQSSNCSHNSNSNEDYLMQRFGQRENSIRSRLPFPQSRSDVYEENINISSTPPTAKATASSAPATANHMQKEISRQSMCSVESEAKTEFTDLSPSTPCSNKFAQANFPSTASTNNGKAATCSGELADTATTRPPPNFVASFPYSSESQSLEAHRRSTKNIHELMLTPEAHYEVINDTACQFSNIRAHNPTQQRPTNLIASKRNELTHKPEKPPGAFQSEMEWSENDDDRQIL